MHEVQTDEGLAGLRPLSKAMRESESSLTPAYPAVICRVSSSRAVLSFACAKTQAAARRIFASWLTALYYEKNLLTRSRLYSAVSSISPKDMTSPA